MLKLHCELYLNICAMKWNSSVYKVKRWERGVWVKHLVCSGWIRLSASQHFWISIVKWSFSAEGGRQGWIFVLVYSNWTAKNRNFKGYTWPETVLAWCKWQAKSSLVVGCKAVWAASVGIPAVKSYTVKCLLQKEEKNLLLGKAESVERMWKLFYLPSRGNGPGWRAEAQTCFLWIAGVLLCYLNSPQQCLFACFQISLFRRSSDRTRDCYDNTLHS